MARRAPAPSSPPSAAGQLARQATDTFLALATAIDAGALPPPEPSRAREAIVALTLQMVVAAFAEALGVTTPEAGARARLGRFEGQFDLFTADRSWISGRVPEATLASMLDAFVPLAREAPLEAIGTAYEQLIGFDVVRASGPSVALAPSGTDIDLDVVLASAPGLRAELVTSKAGAALSARAARALEEARDHAHVLAALGSRVAPWTPAPVPRGALLAIRSEARRRTGSHYTPRAITETVVEKALAPLACVDPRDLRVCDPAMGCGAFLLAVCRALTARLGDPRGAREIIEQSIYGVDRDPMAVDLARIAVWLFGHGGAPPSPALFRHLRAGDSLLGAWRADLGELADGLAPGALARALDAHLAIGFWPDDASAPGASLRPELAADAVAGADRPELAVARRVAGERRFLHWEVAFPEVFARGGFDAIVGNPPWVAYAGRAAQPIGRAEFAHFLKTSPAFHGYRTLHGLFVHRAATLLRGGGRLGLVVPTSISDLAGYAPVRDAHDALADVDDDLPDFGADEFDGVFQPAMAILSTRRAAPPPAPRPGRAWRLRRSDLDPDAARLLERLSTLPALAPATFGERGYQTEAGDAPSFRALDAPEPPFTVPIREGRDIGAFVAHAPRLYVDPSGLARHLRPPEQWRAVGVLIRQTARYPMAALADGAAFRNSILAGFGSSELDAFALLAYLNSTAVRWLHFTRFRDARQGMPQVKIGHLRCVPAPPALGVSLPELSRMGRDLGARNRGITDDEQAALDDLVSRALELGPVQRQLLARFARDNPPPLPTRGDGGS
jgi:hypothetical protein